MVVVTITGNKYRIKNAPRSLKNNLNRCCHAYMALRVKRKSKWLPFSGNERNRDTMPNLVLNTYSI